LSGQKSPRPRRGAGEPGVTYAAGKVLKRSTQGAESIKCGMREKEKWDAGQGTGSTTEARCLFADKKVGKKGLTNGASISERDT